MAQTSIDQLLGRRFAEPDSDAENVIVLTSEPAEEPTIIDSQPESHGSNRYPEYQDAEEFGVDMSMNESLPEIFTPSDNDCEPLPSVMKNNILNILNGNHPRAELSAETAPVDVSATDLKDLEKRAFKSGKAVSLADILSKPKPKTEKTPDISQLESRVFQNHKKVSMKDFLSARSKHKFVVTLKVDPEALAFFKKFENPLKTRGNIKYCKAKGRFSDFDHPVTLKIDKHKLKSITDGHDFSRVKAKSSIFESMMRSSVSNKVKLTPLQKLKELDPPAIPKSALHVKDEPESSNDITFLNQLPVKAKRPQAELDEPFAFPAGDIDRVSSKIEVHPKALSDQDYYGLFKSTCDIESPLFKYIYEQESRPRDHQALWTSVFHPNTIASLLISEQNQSRLRNWLLNSFARLKNQSFNGSRDAKKKQQKKSRQPIDPFVVPDDYSSGTEEEIFTPILIVHGKTGSGKSTSIYAAMKEMNGFVHEMNAGQVRSRREISGTLKELCTTHSLHKTEEGQFKDGIVLLEDCDILFEQDRTFWVAVQEILDISRRPIVITCSDIEVIPKQIFNYAREEEAIIDLDEGSRDLATIKTFLWACCFSKHFNVGDDVLSHLVEENGTDIRKSLLACQAICLAPNSPGEVKGHKQVFDVSYGPSRSESPSNETLDSLQSSLEVLSLGDIIDTNSFSQIGHENIANEFIDIYYLDDTHRLRQPLMPHERKVSDFFCKDSPPETTIQRTYNHIRNVTNTFVASRSRPLSGHLQGLYDIRETMRATRSIADSEVKPWVPEITGIPDGSISIYLPHSSFIMDFAPFCRYWYELQVQLDKVDPSVKHRLRWRDFQNKSHSITWTSSN